MSDIDAIERLNIMLHDHKELIANYKIKMRDCVKNGNIEMMYFYNNKIRQHKKYISEIQSVKKTIFKRNAREYDTI